MGVPQLRSHRRSVRKRRRSAPPATIPRATLRFTRKIIKEKKRRIIMEQKFYICKHCGNIIAKIKDTAFRHLLRRADERDRSPAPPMPPWRSMSPSGRWKTASSMSRSAPWSIPCCRSTTSSGYLSRPSRAISAKELHPSDRRSAPLLSDEGDEVKRSTPIATSNGALQAPHMVFVLPDGNHDAGYLQAEKQRIIKDNRKESFS